MDSDGHEFIRSPLGFPQSLPLMCILTLAAKHALSHEVWPASWLTYSFTHSLTHSLTLTHPPTYYIRQFTL